MLGEKICPTPARIFRVRDTFAEDSLPYLSDMMTMMMPEKAKPS
jgi:hypothetical protein